MAKRSLLSRCPSYCNNTINIKLAATSSALSAYEMLPYLLPFSILFPLPVCLLAWSISGPTLDQQCGLTSRKSAVTCHSPATLEELQNYASHFFHCR